MNAAPTKDVWRGHDAPSSTLIFDDTGKAFLAEFKKSFPSEGETDGLGPAQKYRRGILFPMLSGPEGQGGLKFGSASNSRSRLFGLCSVLLDRSQE